MKRIALVAAIAAVGLLRGGVEQSGALDTTVSNAFWNCRNHVCNVYREQSAEAVAVTFVAGSVEASAALDTFDSWWFTRDWSAGINLNTFPPADLIIIIR